MTSKMAQNGAQREAPNGVTSGRHHRSPASIRNEAFNRRMRGLDEEQVYGYLDGLADQIQEADDEHRELRADNERLRTDNQRLEAELRMARSQLDEAEQSGERVNDQVVQLLSQAQLVAEEMVEDVSKDARQRLGQARDQERKIIEEAMQTAEQTRRDAEALIRWTVPGANLEAAPGPSADGWATREQGGEVSPAAELERIRSFAEAAQSQMQSIMESFATEVGRLGDVEAQNGSGRHRHGSSWRDSD